jgi:hypothetical protein
VFVLQFLIFVLYVIVTIVKVIINRKNRLIKTWRPVSFLTGVWVVIWISEIGASETIKKYSPYFYTEITFRYQGLWVELLGIALIIVSLYKKSSTYHTFGYLLLFIGLFLSYPNVLTLIVAVMIMTVNQWLNHNNKKKGL